MQLAYILHINRKISTTATRQVKVSTGALAALQAGLPSILSRPITEKAERRDLVNAATWEGAYRGWVTWVYCQSADIRLRFK